MRVDSVSRNPDHCELFAIISKATPAPAPVAAAAAPVAAAAAPAALLTNASHDLLCAILALAVIEDLLPHEPPKHE